eukprot:294090-Pleurochrysis_carterae.AAC.2
MDYAVSVRPSCRHSPSDEWNNTSHLHNDGNSANHHPFPGHESVMPVFGPNHQITAPQSNFRSPGCRARWKMHPWPSTVVITRAIGGRRFEG